MDPVSGSSSVSSPPFGSHVDLVRRAAQAANLFESVEQTAQAVVDAVCGAIGWPLGHLYEVRNPPSGQLAPTTVWHVGDHERFRIFRQVTQATWLPSGAGLPGRAAASRAPVWEAEMTHDTDYSRGNALEEAGIRAGFAVPVVSGRDVVAVFEFYSPLPAPVDVELLDVMAMVADQVARVADRERAGASAEETRRIIETANDAFVRLGNDGVVTEWGGTAEAMFGWAREEAIGRRVGELIIPARYRAAHERGLQRFLTTGERTVASRRELTALHRSGTEFPVELTTWATNDGAGGVSGFIRDITERKSFEGQLTRQALHDRLTGLPNRTLLRDRLELALARGGRHGWAVALLVLDLDRFKVVNDSLGHHGGDQLLVAVADRLLGAVRPGDTVARMGGDEYAVLCEDITGEDEAVKLAADLLSAFEHAFEVRGTDVSLTTSVGLVLATGGEDPDLLLRDADVAMYRAKQGGRATYRVFDEAMRAEAAERLSVENDLRRALRQGQLRLLYQPIVRLDTETVVGFEALVRWAHPERGLLSPADFITPAEESGLIVPLGQCVLEAACQQAAAWQRRPGTVEPLRVSVNVSGKQLQQPEWPDEVAAVLTESGLKPGQLVLEITESVLMDDTETICARLDDLRRLGVRVAIDDFGTGYSSLSYLRRLPVDILKIDKSFIDGVADGPQESALARAVLKLATTLGLEAVAEGVATRKQLAQLKRLRCPFGQGFLFSPPLPPEAIEELLARPSLSPTETE